ncbi:MAG TPA: hypothetical protein VG457_12065 [Planctomycetota bacterium]|jgi:hypothetical protein|nr:hypothetical protein [Planctomycetota bacterium]
MSNCTNQSAQATVIAQVGDSTAPAEVSFSVPRYIARTNQVLATVAVSSQATVLNISLNQVCDSGNLLCFPGYSFWFSVSDIPTAIGTQRVLNVTMYQLELGAAPSQDTWTFMFSSSPNVAPFTGTPILGIISIDWQCNGGSCAAPATAAKPAVPAAAGVPRAPRAN